MAQRLICQTIGVGWSVSLAWDGDGYVVATLTTTGNGNRRRGFLVGPAQADAIGIYERETRALLTEHWEPR